jgi:flagellar biosynthetic protein FlhB
MAEDRDESQQTEQPTPRRLEEARRKGQVASSREAATFLMLGVTVLGWMALVPPLSAQVTAWLAVLLQRAGTLRVDEPGAGEVLLNGLGITAAALVLPLAAYLAAPVIGAALQNAFVWSTESLALKAERISPLSGLRRLASAKALLEIAKGLLKVGLVGTAVVMSLWPDRRAIVTAGELPLEAQLELLRQVVFHLLATAAATVGLIAMLDYALARLALMRQLRMSRREVLDEHKQNEGDPIIRQRLKSLRLEKARRRMMADVPKSTVVITNPTHYAVALRYVAGETAAPRLLAKGVDEVARRIRELATEHRIPIVENPPLARALHAGCELGDFIPPAHYQAVAEIVGYVLRLEAAQRPPA